MKLLSRDLLWSRILHKPQTYCLVAGAAIGYLGLIVWQGTSWLVLGIGGGITLAMLTAWLKYLRQEWTNASANLLDKEIFLAQLAMLARSSPGSQHWQTAQSLAIATQECAVGIAKREPTLTAELLAALHTVLELTQAVATALQAVHSVKSVTYGPIAQQKLHTSSVRLQETHNQLQHLHDQVLLSTPSPNLNLPESLRLVIDANRIALQNAIQRGKKL